GGALGMVAGLGRAAKAAEHFGEVVVRIRRAVAIVRVTRVVVGQFAANLQRAADLGLRLRQPARLRQHDAEAAEGVREAVAEVGVGGLAGAQFTVDLQRPAVLALRLRRPARL